MNRDETIALFQKCDKARAEALAAGKSYDEAHEAAKAAWNGWAEAMLVERKRLEQASEWAAETDFWGELKGQNDQTRDWIARASADFSDVHFATSSSLPDLIRQSTATGSEADSMDHRDKPGDDQGEGNRPMIQVAGEVIDFSGFIFPANAGFASAQFHAYARFSSRFHANAGFDSAQFHAGARFGSARFHANARFDSAQFHVDADFYSAQFHADARFGSAQFHGYTLLPQRPVSPRGPLRRRPVPRRRRLRKRPVPLRCRLLQRPVPRQRRLRRRPVPRRRRLL